MAFISNPRRDLWDGGICFAEQAFASWLAEAGEAVLDPGAPIKAVAQVSNGALAPQVEVFGYSILQGDSVETVTAILAKHPFVGRGGTLQVSEMLSV